MTTWDDFTMAYRARVAADRARTPAQLRRAIERCDAWAIRLARRNPADLDVLPLLRAAAVCCARLAALDSAGPPRP